MSPASSKTQLKQRNTANQSSSTKKSLNNNSNSNNNNNSNHKSTKKTSFNKDEMVKYVIWRRPIQTLYYFLIELIHIIIEYVFKFLKYRKLVLTLTLLTGLIVLGFNIEGAHLPVLYYLRKKIIWCSYWLGLGIASSIGLGTGLHTFLLYLGPFIAQVTLAAYECQSLDFPEPPYPDQVVCPFNKTANAEAEGDSMSTSTMAIVSSVSILSIMAKVRLESFMWGAGTAIGELPPYFMARASALSSIDNRKSSSDLEDQDEELIEFEHLLEAEKADSSKLSFFDRLRLSVFKIIKKVGFIGILLCASIPNPLFDLAGITCGHFMVRFWTFFGATLIASFRQSICFTGQAAICWSKHSTIIPRMVEYRKKKLHRFGGATDAPEAPNSESILSWILNKIVLLMVLFFVVSIVNSLAQRHYKRVNTSLPSSNTKKVAND